MWYETPEGYFEFSETPLTAPGYRRIDMNAKLQERRPTMNAPATEVEVTPAEAAIPDDRLVKIYMRIRDARDAIKKEMEAKIADLEAQQKRVAAELKRRAQERGQSSFQTEFGTVYLSEALKASCQDWGVFHDWIKATDNLDFLEQRVKAGAVKEFMESHDGDLPPGISVFKEVEARVRRPTVKKAQAEA